MSKSNEKIHDYLKRRLKEFRGWHSQIAKETGVSQPTISRIYAKGCSPTLESAQPLIDWFERFDRNNSAPNILAKRVRVKRSAAVAPSTLSN